MFTNREVKNRRVNQIWKKNLAHWLRAVAYLKPILNYLPGQFEWQVRVHMQGQTAKSELEAEATDIGRKRGLM